MDSPAIFGMGCGTVVIGIIMVRWPLVMWRAIIVYWLFLTSAFAGSVLDFGADPTGVTDSAPAFNAAIAASVAIDCGPVLVPHGTYSIGSTIPLGNGSATAMSSICAPVLAGSPPVSAPVEFIGYQASASKLVWKGQAGGLVLAVNGPIQGWGMENLHIDCAGIAADGITVTSAQFGAAKKISLESCTDSGLVSTTVPMISGVDNVDSLHNRYEDFWITVPPVRGAKGVVLTGTHSSNTDYNILDNFFIWLSPTPQPTYGIYLQATDSDQLRDIHFASDGPGAVCMAFDYTVNWSWPASLMIYGIDTGKCAYPWISAGTSAGGNSMNFVWGIIGTNGAKAPNLPNLTVK